MNKISYIFVIFMSVALFGCAGGPKPETEKVTVEEMYNNAMDMMEEGAYLDAIDAFNDLEREYPYSWWADRAQMMVSYAQYRRSDYDEAIASADRFIRLHPGHKDLAYLFYIKGLSFYERISDVKRDQSFTEEALAAFNELVQRFPESEYVADAKLKITLCRDHLAGKEMEIGRYYLEKGRFVAAINRFRYVVEVYQTTSQTPEALYRLTEAYLAIGIHNEAQMSAAVLGHNYPSSEWYKDAYSLLKGKGLAPQKQEKSWLKEWFSE